MLCSKLLAHLSIITTQVEGHTLLSLHLGPGNAFISLNWAQENEL